MRNLAFLETRDDKNSLKSFSALMGDFISELPQALKGIELFLRRLALPLEKIRVVVAVEPE